MIVRICLILLTFGLSGNILVEKNTSKPIDTFTLCKNSIIKSPSSDTTITLKAITGLQYSLARFAVKPNQKITILFENDDDMAHNLVITKPNARLEVVNAALALGDKSEGMNHVPKSAKIIFSSKILEPNQSQTLSFVAPETEGVYPYVCTFPGHGFVMYGAMYVSTKPLPKLENDKNIPPNARKEMAMEHQHKPSPHPYELSFPMYYRTFMPDCSPAAIAVALPNAQSYCWDAGKCYLRYAWSGEFLDNTDHWKGNGNALAKVLGKIYFRDSTTYPLKVGDAQILPKVKFKGYDLVNRYPVFNYEIDDIKVKEFIKPLTSGNGLSRKFSFQGNKKTIFFVNQANKRIIYSSSLGKLKENILKIPAGTREVVLTMKVK